MRIKYILPLLILSACCTKDYPGDCDENELAEIKKEAERERTPQFITVKDNVRLYRVWTNEPHAESHWTYFTTPCGDVSSVISYREGRTAAQIPTTVSGTGCH